MRSSCAWRTTRTSWCRRRPSGRRWTGCGPSGSKYRWDKLIMWWWCMWIICVNCANLSLVKFLCTYFAPSVMLHKGHVPFNGSFCFILSPEKFRLTRKTFDTSNFPSRKSNTVWAKKKEYTYCPLSYVSLPELRIREMFSRIRIRPKIIFHGSWPNLDKNSKFRNFLNFFLKKILWISFVYQKTPKILKSLNT